MLVERIKGRVADQMVDIPVPTVMEEVVAVVQEEEEVQGPGGPTPSSSCRPSARFSGCMATAAMGSGGLRVPKGFPSNCTV